MKDSPTFKKFDVYYTTKRSHNIRKFTTQGTDELEAVRAARDSIGFEIDVVGVRIAKG